MQIFEFSENGWRFVVCEQLDSETKPKMAPCANDSCFFHRYEEDTSEEMERENHGWDRCAERIQMTGEILVVRSDNALA
jgi:hypothetical protein